MAQRDFTVDGIAFQQRNLGSEDSLRGFNWLTKAIAQASLSAKDLDAKDESAMAALVSGALGALEDLPKFSALFTSVCQVDLSTVGTEGAFGQGTYAKLANTKEQLFGGGKVSRHLAWIVDCVVWEYSDFLSGTGRAPLVEMGKKLKSLFGSTGGSGQSTPTA